MNQNERKSNWHFTKILHTTTESPVWQKLRPTSKVVYFNLVKHYNFNYKIAYPTNKDIMREEGIASATLESAFKELNNCFFVVRKNFLNLDDDPFLSSFKSTFFKNDKNYFYLPDFLLQDLFDQVHGRQGNIQFPQFSIDIFTDLIKGKGYSKFEYRYSVSKHPYLVFTDECSIFEKTLNHNEQESIQKLHINYILKLYNKLIELLMQKIELKKSIKQSTVNITNILGNQVNIHKSFYLKKLNNYNLKLGSSNRLSEKEIEELIPRINRDNELTEDLKDSIKQGVRSGIIGRPSPSKN